MLFYMLAFCRIALVLLFAYAFFSKVRDVSGFAQTITSFKLLPLPWSQPMAWLFLMGEGAVVLLLLLGGVWLPLGLGLALALLALFTAVLLSVLARDIHTSCHCFGRRDQPVTYADVWRNGGLMVLAAGGWWLTATVGGVGISFAAWVLVGVAAAVFVLLWSSLGDIVALLRAA